jgi:hypothetical protein
MFLRLQGASNNVDAVAKYIGFTVAFCIQLSKLWQPNPTVCKSTSDTVKREYEKVRIAAYQDGTEYTQTKELFLV